MKRIIVFCISLALLLAGCSSDTNPPECGGKVDHSDKNALKIIESTELTAVSARFYLYDDVDMGGDGSSYDFTLKRNDAGALMLNEDSTYHLSVAVGNEVLLQAQEIIVRNELAALNGDDCYTSGLPEEFQPCSFTADYASGERIYFHLDNDPSAVWSAELLNCFRHAFADAGYPDVLITPAVQQLNEKSMAAYEAFLNGDEILYFDHFNRTFLDSSNCEDIDLFESGGAYTFDEMRAIMTERFQKGNSKADVNFEKAYIDCGCDGVSELAIYVSDTGSCDAPINEFIIKYLEGALQVCYITESYYRNTEMLANTGGLISIYGAASAWEHVFANAVIDANGDYHFLWADDATYDFGHIEGYIPVSQAAYEHAEELPENIILHAYSFASTYAASEDPDFYSLVMYDPETFEVIDSSELYEDGSLCHRIFDEAGAELVTPEEAARRIAAREAGFGVSEKMSAGTIEYSPIFE